MNIKDKSDWFKAGNRQHYLLHGNPSMLKGILVISCIVIIVILINQIVFVEGKNIS
jgi:hypothetical protein